MQNRGDKTGWLVHSEITNYKQNRQPLTEATYKTSNGTDNDTSAQTYTQSPLLDPILRLVLAVVALFRRRHGRHHDVPAAAQERAIEGVESGKDTFLTHEANKGKTQRGDGLQVVRVINGADLAARPKQFLQTLFPETRLVCHMMKYLNQTHFTSVGRSSTRTEYTVFLSSNSWRRLISKWLFGIEPSKLSTTTFGKSNASLVMKPVWSVELFESKYY